MEAHEALERFETSHGNHHGQGHGAGVEVDHFARTAALMVAVIAAFLAIATFLGNESNKEAIQKQTEQADANSQSASFSILTTVFRSDILLLEANTASSDTGLASASKIGVKTLNKYQGDIKTGERTFAERKAEKRKEVSHANDQHLLYEIAAVLLQVSIVLASVAIIARRRFLLWGSGGVSAAGVVVLLIGYVS
jgi:hypothetical protein